MPRLKSYWNGKANALMTPDQRKATDERYAAWQHQRDLNSKAKWNADAVVRARQWALDHPEEARAKRVRASEARNARRLADPEYQAKYKATKSSHRAAYRSTPHGKRTHRAEVLRPKGWSADRYDSALQEQHNRCAICQEPFLQTPCADHAHTKPPVPRGLLCNGCNSALGFLKDSPKLCEAASAYLRHWNKPCGGCGMCLDCLREERVGVR